MEKNINRKYHLVKDEVSITTCGDEDLKESWQWVGKKEIILTYFVDGSQLCQEKIVSMVHNGYFELTNKELKPYIKSVNGRTYTSADIPKTRKSKIKS